MNFLCVGNVFSADCSLWCNVSLQHITFHSHPFPIRSGVFSVVLGVSLLDFRFWEDARRAANPMSVSFTGILDSLRFHFIPSDCCCSIGNFYSIPFPANVHVHPQMNNFVSECKIVLLICIIWLRLVTLIMCHCVVARYSLIVYMNCISISEHPPRTSLLRMFLPFHSIPFHSMTLQRRNDNVFSLKIFLFFFLIHLSYREFSSHFLSLILPLCPLFLFHAPYLPFSWRLFLK